MRPGTQKQLRFIGKSLMWSLLLYVTVMVAFNWNEVSATVSGRNIVSVVSTLPSAPGVDSNATSRVARHTGVIKSIVSIAKTISGFTSISSGI
jgi:hypothetical protein